MSFIATTRETILHMKEYLERIASKLFYAKDNSVNEISVIFAELTKIEIPETDDIFLVAGRIGHCEHLIRQSINVLSAINFENVSTAATQTYMLELKGDIHDYVNTAKIFVSSTPPYYGEVVATFVDTPDDIEKKYYDNPYSHKLFAQWLQFAIDNKKYDQQILIDMVERAKDNVFATKKSNVCDQFPLQRFRLIPIIQDTTIDAIAKHFFNVKCSSLEKLAKAATVKSVGLIVLRMTTTRPLEYNIGNLVDPKKVEETFSPDNHGVSARTLGRFSLVKFFESGGELWYKSEMLSGKDCSKFLVIRTLNGTTWDAMDYISPQLAQKILRGSSPRIQAIQQMKNEIFAKHLGKPINADMEIKEENSAFINELINRITNNLVAYIDKSLNPLPTNKMGIELAIRDPKFVEIMYTELLRTFSDSGVDALDKDFVELFSSFASAVVSHIIVQFSRALKINMIERGPKVKMFKETAPEHLQTKLYAIFVDVIVYSLQTTIKSKENIYEKTFIKAYVLNLIRKNYI